MAFLPVSPASGDDEEEESERARLAALARVEQLLPLPLAVAWRRRVEFWTSRRANMMRRGVANNYDMRKEASAEGARG